MRVSYLGGEGGPCSLLDKVASVRNLKWGLNYLSMKKECTPFKELECVYDRGMMLGSTL